MHLVSDFIVYNIFFQNCINQYKLSIPNVIKCKYSTDYKSNRYKRQLMYSK